LISSDWVRSLRARITFLSRTAGTRTVIAFFFVRARVYDNFT
jgi:hypothetical protein